MEKEGGGGGEEERGGDGGKLKLRRVLRGRFICMPTPEQEVPHL